MKQQSAWKKRWFAAAMLAVATLLVPSLATAAYADIEVGDTVYVGQKIGYGGTGLFAIYEETPVDPANPGEPDYWAYCIEHDVSAETRLVGNVGDLSSFLGENYFTAPEIQGKVLWVLAHSYPAMSLEEFGAAAGVPGISQNDAIEATQYAIWRYTDLTFDASWSWETADSEAAYWHLVNGANASAGMTPGDLETTVSVTAPAAVQTADSLVGPFVVNTSRPVASVSSDPALPITDASGDAIDADAVIDGQEIYLDLRGDTAAGSATVTAEASGTSATGKVVSVPSSSGGTPTADAHAQSIVLVTPDTTKTSDSASVQWGPTAEPDAPGIGTSLVDAADGDRVLGWNGGTVIDTVAYRNLTPGAEYTVSGELMNKADGSATGITGSATFTPTAADGSIDVTFVVPEGLAGEVLVAFEELFEGGESTGEPVAEHRDIDDAAQTVTVEEQPKSSTPTPTSTPPTAEKSALATTGSDPSTWPLALAIFGLTAGALLLLAKRRVQA